MTPIRKTLFGYDTSSVKRSIRNYQRVSMQEIVDLEEKIAAAKKKRSALQVQWSDLALVPTADEESAAEETAAAVEWEEQADEQIFECAAESVVEPVIKPTNVIAFKRKEDVPFEKSGYWGGVEAYLSTPVILNEVTMNPEDFVSALPQVEGIGYSGQLSNYFGYSIDEASLLKASMALPAKDLRGNDRLIGLPQIKSDKPYEEKEVVNSIAKTALAPAVAPKLVAQSGKRSESVPAGNGSNELSREIRQLRYKYIVGKSAGEELLNHRNELIIAKHQPITEAVVDEADREGKLALLIVHMTIPGLGEET